MNGDDLCFVIGDGVKESFFEPEKAIRLSIEATFPDALVIAGVFKSKTDARNNGWGEKQTATFKRVGQFDVVQRRGLFIPEGFTDMFCGKYNTRISIWKYTREYKETIVKDELFTRGYNDYPSLPCPFEPGHEWNQWWLGWSFRMDEVT